MKNKVKKLLRAGIYDILEDYFHKKIDLLEVGKRLLTLYDDSGVNLLTKLEIQLDALKIVHGQIVKEYELHEAIQAFKFKDGAVYSVRLDRKTGNATLDNSIKS